MTQLPTYQGAMLVTRRRFLASAASAAGMGSCRPFELEAAAAPPSPATLSLLAAPRADAPAALSFDGSAGGPVLRMVQGRTLALSLRNGLGEATSLQWHGLRAPNDIVGEIGLHGTATLPPGQSMEQRFVPPDSGTFWLHPAAVPHMADQTAAGLRGVLVVEERVPPVVDRDLLVTVSDGPGGLLLVNGAAAPLGEAIVPGGRCRLRVVSASTTRILVLAVEGARPKIIAIDGQPSELFEPLRDALPIGPGARFELMLDVPRAPDGTVRLLSRGIAIGEGAKTPDQVLLELTAAGAPREALPPIVALPPNPALPVVIPLEQSVRGTMLIEPVPGAAGDAARFQLNGKASLALPAAPLLTVAMGGVVTLGLDNRTPRPVPLRLHGHVMRLLHARDDGWEPYWRDSVILPPASVNHVAFIADSPGDWLLESAMFDQAAFGLRHWFRVA